MPVTEVSEVQTQEGAGAEKKMTLKELLVNAASIVFCLLLVAGFVAVVMFSGLLDPRKPHMQERANWTR